DDHHVVRPVRCPADQLDQLDLGDVSILELVDKDVAVLPLPASKEIRPDLPELRDRGDLLAEVERSSSDQLGLVGAIDPGELLEADDLEGCAVADVGRRKLVDLEP